MAGRLCVMGRLGAVLCLVLSVGPVEAISYGSHSSGVKNKSCAGTSKLNLKSSNKLSDYRYLCYGIGKQEGKTFYCETAQKDMDCGSVKLKNSAEKWEELLEKAQKAKKTSDQKTLKSLDSSSSYKSLLLASSTDLMKLKKPVQVSSRLRLQTGPYSRLTLSKSPLTVKCLEDILFAGQILQREFQDFNFEVDSKITQCKNLRDGASLLVKNKKQVIKNLKLIHSPMHTIYLTDKSKFNNDTLGEMGLYVNVNKKNEIKKRLVDFTINKELRMSGMSIPK